MLVRFFSTSPGLLVVVKEKPFLNTEFHDLICLVSINIEAIAFTVAFHSTQ